MILRVVGLNAGGGCRVHVDQLNNFLEEKKLIKTITFIPFFNKSDLISDAKVTKYKYINKWRLIRFIYLLCFKRKQIKVIHLHLKNAIIIYGFICLLFRIPYIVTIHQSPFEGNSLKASISDHLFILILKYAEQVISISGFISKALATRGITSKVIYNYSTSSSAKKIHFKSKTSVYKICIVGELSKRKGIADIPKLAKLLPTNYLINIYGDGPLRFKCQNIKNVKLHGYVSSNKIYQDNDILLSLSFNEPFGRTITEAYQYHIPVIARDSGAFPELVDKKFLFTKIDEIPKLLELLVIEKRKNTINFYNNIDRYAQKFQKNNFENKHWEILKCYCT